MTFKSLINTLKTKGSINLTIGTKEELEARYYHIYGNKIKRDTSIDPFGNTAEYSLYK